MRLASFFIASIALHGAALAVSVSREPGSVPSFIPVTITSMGDAGAIAPENPAPPQPGGTAAQGNSANRKPSADLSRKEPVAQSEIKHFTTDDESAAAPDNAAPLATAEIVNKSFSDAPFIAVQGHGSGFGEMVIGHGGDNGRGGGGGSSGTGRSTNGSGGPGSQPSGAAYVGAGYRSTDRPNYPERARKEGKEGRVLLRVLVDEEGRSKVVEVNASSGSEALDQAAREAIKRWRFSPARYGGKPVESWVKIPIDFRLTDARD